MKTPKEFLVEKEKELVDLFGEKTWNEEKVYFPYEVIKFIEEYAKLQKTELLKSFNLGSEGKVFDTKK